MKFNNNLLTRLLCSLPPYFVLLLLFLPVLVDAGSIQFEYKENFAVTSSELSGSLDLALSASQPVHNVALLIRSVDQTVRITGPKLWTPQEHHVFQLQVPSIQPLPGRYHLLVSVEYQDGESDWHSYPVGIEYTLTSRQATPLRTPRVIFNNGLLRWQSAGVAADALALTLLPAPIWATDDLLTPNDREFRLQERPDRRAQPGQIYPQLARLDWHDSGIHHSVVLPWSIRTDQRGEWLKGVKTNTKRGWWRSPDVMRIVSVTGFGLALLLMVRVVNARKVTNHHGMEPGIVRYTGMLLAVGLSCWIADHTRLDLWILPTWATGGDTASHILYAKVFEDWVAHGKVSGWMPEVFMGFPAFRYYFPMPFVLGVYLAKFTGLPVAFKFIAMLPAVLLPLGTYVMGSLLKWPIAARLLGAVGATGFVVTTSTSIWGGNLLAQMAGEFAYSWGFLWTVIFWGVLGWALRRGGRRWLWAALMEVLVALSHGYALLIAGFGAFLFLLLYRNWRWGLRIVLQVHALAFLLLGFWLIPLMSNLPWTIPNDTSMWVDDWKTLWPKQLWPLSLGLPCLVAILIFSRKSRIGLGVPLGIFVLALAAFHTVSHLGLADIRFFPYAQWGAAVAMAAGAGWLLYRWVPVSLLWSAALAIALLAWWEPQMDTIENWSRWNLEGYESRVPWLTYRAVADELAGTLKDPRVIFEHDPDNKDFGSTRTVEAMPLFGSRPVLEGLYMESAISSAFIYQLQAEISARPSSPLSRFPSSKGPVDAAVGHMRELFTDTLVLRSKTMKARFSSDNRFEVITREDPWLVLRLKDLQTSLVETVDAPVTIMPREDWMSSAFRRFRLSHPYTDRQVYVDPDQEWHTPAPVTDGQIRILNMDRERLVFETTALGQPHIIRMTYHPKWKSMAGEPIFLTEPAFMLIVPQSSPVELRYDLIAADRVGIWFTVIGIVLFGWVVISSKNLPPPITPKGPGLVPVVTIVLLVVSGAVGAWWNNPERVYKRGHELLSDKQYQKASRDFDSAYANRKVPGRKAEALFWSGRSLQQGEDYSGALEHLKRLVKAYPDNYWTPESLYRIVILEKRADNEAGARAAFDQLLRDFPENSWSRRAIEESDADGAWLNDPERVYQHGHELLSDKQYQKASRNFDSAYASRKVPGRKAEALFWAGRSLELGEDYSSAVGHFKQLAKDYPDNYWTPESLYRVVMLEKRADNELGARTAFDRLLRDFPENTWTQRAVEESGTAN